MLILSLTAMGRTEDDFRLINVRGFKLRFLDVFSFPFAFWIFNIELVFKIRSRLEVLRMCENLPRHP